MAYEKNMKAAALRHYKDGRRLLDAKCFDNAGYHFGFAAECAIKQKLLDCGVRADDDSIWAHWPKLRLAAMMAISGRSAEPIRRLLEVASYMQGWDTDMRYAINGSVDERLAEKWRGEADKATGLLW